MDMRKVLLVGCSGILVIAFAVFVLEKTHVINLYRKSITKTVVLKPVDKIDYSPATPADNANNDQVKQDSLKATPNPSNLGVTITRATQLPDSKALAVRALIEGTTSGTCTLELSQNGSIGLSKQAAISQQNNIFTCNGFDIPQSDLPGVGEWTAKITVNNGTNMVNATQNIMVEK